VVERTGEVLRPRRLVAIAAAERRSPVAFAISGFKASCIEGLLGRALARLLRSGGGGSQKLGSIRFNLRKILIKIKFLLQELCLPAEFLVDLGRQHRRVLGWPAARIVVHLSESRWGRAFRGQRHCGWAHHSIRHVLH
jgi:hypothetical protein